MAAGNVPPLPRGPKLHLLLLGITGGGKSATGNTILEDRRAFLSTGSSTSVTKEVLRKEKTIGGRDICVVDTPGTMDTEDIEAPIEEIASAIVQSHTGYDAFVLVLKYGTRLTKEQHEAVMQVENIFGDDFWKYAILVMTGGDTFEYEHDDKSFDEFLQEQSLTGSTKSITSISNKVAGGAVIFNNLERDAVRRRQQVVNLVKKVDAMRSINGGNKYTNELFQMAEELKQIKSEKEALEEVTKATKEKAGGCFPGEMTVVQYPGMVVPISTITPGDLVLCGGKHAPIYQEVYMMGHLDAESMMRILKIKTPNHLLQVSPGHYLPVGDGYMRAKDIRIGNWLPVVNDDDRMITLEQVESIEPGFAQGCFNPFTMNGTIFVNGVLATCYEESGPRPQISHILMGAARGLYHVNGQWLQKVNQSRVNGVPTWAWKMAQLMK